MGILSKMPFVLFSIMNFYSSIKTRLLVPFGSFYGLASQVALVIKNPPANAGDLRDMGSIPGSGRSPGEGHRNPLQYSGRLQSIRSQRVGHDWGGLACMHMDTARQSPWFYSLLPWFYSFLLLGVLFFSFFLSLSADRHWGVLEHWSLIWQQVCIPRTRDRLALSRCSINRYWMNTFYISEYLFSWK